MNDVAKATEPEPRDIIGRTDGGYVVQVFNVGRSNEVMKFYTPDEADKVAGFLMATAEQIRRGGNNHG
jgi:hypothetical protein